MGERSFPDQVEHIFQQALDLAPEARTAYVIETANGDERLRDAVEKLLQASDKVKNNPAWDAPALQNLANQSAALAGDTAFSRYRLLDRIGSGGMALVQKAVRADDEFSKVVALKIVLTSDPDSIGRFRQERQILASLEHPNIARLLDGGSTEDGRPFLVMEYVDGVPIDRYVAEKKLPLSDVLNLFRKICSAVSYAHRNLVVHRDLKPANILVTAGGEPKLLDFGIAKLLDGSVARTRTGAGAMTPEYASPEQVRGAPITTATDVYSLGVLLYELLCGERPYRRRGSAFDLANAITMEDSEPLGKNGKRFDRDLENIVQMALRKQPERRYASVEQFSDDIRRYQEHYPIAARADTRGYRVRKFIGRNRLAVGAAAAIALILVSGIVATTTQRNAAERQRLRAESDEASNRRLLYAAQMNLAYQAWDTANAGRAIDLLDAQRPKPGEKDLRGFDWYMLWGLTRGRSRVLPGPAGRVHGVALSADGRLAAAGIEGGKVCVWDAATEQLVRSFDVHSPNLMAFSPGGNTLAVPSDDGSVTLWALNNGQLVRTLQENKEPVWSVAFSPDGRTLAAASLDHTAKVWRTEDGRLLATLKGHRGGVTAVAFSPGGTILATASQDHTARLWDLSSAAQPAVLEGHSWWVLGAVFSPDGRMLATSGNGDIKFWDVASHREIAAIHGDGTTVGSIAFSPDGKRLAAGAADNLIRIYDVSSRNLYDTLRGHADFVQSVAFSPAGKTLVSGSSDGTVRLWDLAKEPGTFTFDAHKDWVWDIKFSPDGQTLASASKDGTVKLWNVADRRQIVTLQHPQWVNGVAFSPDGTRLATADDDRLVRLWNPAGQKLATLSGHNAVVECVAFSPDGQTLASGSKTGEIKLWNSLTGAPIASLRSPNRNLIWNLAFSPGGRYLAAAEGGMQDLVLSTGHLVTIWDPVSQRMLATLQGHSADVRAVVFSPDGSILASGSYDGTIKLWDFRTRREIATLKTHKVYSLAFSPDGKRIASAGQDKTIKLWDVATRQELVSLLQPSEVHSVAFSPDNRYLAAASSDGKVRVWRAAGKVR